MSNSCNVCSKAFSTRFNLNKHLRNIHKEENITPLSYDISVGSYKCQEDDCRVSFKKNFDLINHLVQEHEFTFEIEKVEFTDFKDFIKWKNSVEETNNCNYVVSSQFRSNCEGHYIYYKCNRSGKVRTIVNNSRKRSIKSQGSCKLNRACTSEIKVFRSDKLYITWIKTHYGHLSQLEHIRLSKQVRCSIAYNLMSGVPSVQILNTYKNQISDDLQRVNLLTKKDISNIKNSYRLITPKEEGLECDDKDYIDQNSGGCDAEDAVYQYENVDYKDEDVDGQYYKNEDGDDDDDEDDGNDLGDDELMNLSEECTSNPDKNPVDYSLNEKLLFKMSETFSNFQQTNISLLDAGVASKILDHLTSIDELLNTKINEVQKVYELESNNSNSKMYISTHHIHDHEYI